MSPRNHLLDHAVDLFPPSPDALERVVERHHQRLRHRRIGAGAVGVAIAIAILVALGTGGVFTNHQPVTTPSVTPSQIGTVTITNAGCTLDGGASPSFGPYVLSVSNETDGAKTVVVFKIANDARFARMLTFVDRARPRFGSLPDGPLSDHRQIQARFFEYANTTETDIGPHESLVVPGAFSRGTYGIQCAGRTPERDRSNNFVGPIDVKPATG